MNGNDPLAGVQFGKPRFPPMHEQRASTLWPLLLLAAACLALSFAAVVAIGRFLEIGCR